MELFLTGFGGHGEGGLPAKRIDPRSVRFTHDSIRYTFKGGGTIDDLAEGLRSGAIRAEDVEPIRLVEREGKLYTLDNCRLEAFRRAGVDVPYVLAHNMMSERAILKEWRKRYTTSNEGVSIVVRGELK